MSEAVLTMFLWVAMAAAFVVRWARHRRFRDAAEPAVAAAGVLGDVYGGRGTERRQAPEFDPAPTTSMTLDGDDPLRVYGVGPWDDAGRH